MWLLELRGGTTHLTFSIGDVIHVSAHGGFFVQVLQTRPTLAVTGPYKHAWLVLVRPLLGRTIVEKLSTLYRKALNAKGIGEVETALHVAEFAQRAMEIAGEAERNASTESLVSTLCDLV